MMASPLPIVLIVDEKGIGRITAALPVEVFPCLEEIGASRWAEEVEELVLQTWRMKTIKNPRWETMRDFIEDWRRGVLMATTTGYHNLVIWWNMRTLPQGAEDQARAMENATYRLTDDEATDLSVILLAPKRSSEK